MSNSAVTRIQIDKSSDLIRLLETLLANSWTMEAHGQVQYVPAGMEFGDWEQVPYTDDKAFLKEIQTKLEHGEDTAIRFFYENTEVGCDILYNPKDSQVTLSWGLNRIESNNGTLDFSWYLERLKKSLYHDFRSATLNSYEYDSGAQLLQEREDHI